MLLSQKLQFTQAYQQLNFMRREVPWEINQLFVGPGQFSELSHSMEWNDVFLNKGV